MTTTTHFAAIDSSNITGAVYGIGTSPEAALRDARRGAEGFYSTVAITPAAYRYVQEIGGAPSRELLVTARGVSLLGEE